MLYSILIGPITPNALLYCVITTVIVSMVTVPFIRLVRRCIVYYHGVNNRLVSANDWHMVKFFYILLLLILLLAISLLNFSLSLIISVGITLPCLLAAPVSSSGYVFVCLYVCCAVFVCACVFICMCINPIIMSHTPHKNSPSFRLMNLMCVCSIRMYCGSLYYIQYIDC